MVTLVIYDISDDRLRTNLAKLLENYGLRRVQYSGFVGELNPHDREILSREVERFIGAQRDSVYVVPLCDRCVKTCRIVSVRELSLEEASEVAIV